MAAASALKVGIGAGAYRNTGSYGSPTFTEMGLVKDVVAGFPWNFADASARQSPVMLYAKTQIDIPLQIVMRADDADAAYVAMWAAAMSRTSVVDLLILDGDIATEGVMGMRSEFLVSLQGQTQGPGDVVYTTFDIKPTWTSNGYPRSVIMGAASAPSYTAFS